MTPPDIRVPKAITFTFTNKASSSKFSLPVLLLSLSLERDFLLSFQ